MKKLIASIFSIGVITFFLSGCAPIDVNSGASNGSSSSSPATYTVTFDSQSATVAASPSSMTVTSPATNVGTLPTNPTKTGFNFSGWYTAVNGGGSQFTAATAVTGNITVYAYWTSNPVYTVTYNSAGGSAVGSQTVTLPATTVGTLPTDPTKTGYIFGGWTNSAGAAFTGSTTVNADITVYAKWNSYSYSVTYNSQGGSAVSGSTVNSPATTVGTLPTDPTRSGYSFAGWTNSAGTQFTSTTTVTGNITVYAVWTTNPVYTVTYNSQGGSAVGSQTVTLPATTVGTLPTDPTRTGYIFGGWTNSAGVAFTGSTTVNADITVYAKWNSYSYSVTYNSQGGSAVSGSTVNSPATTVGTLPTDPTRTGYIFGGWTNSSGVAFTASTTVSGNITVYAKWNSYTYVVTYNSQGGSAVASANVNSPSTTVGALPSDPTKTGYVFGGWTNSSGVAFTASTTVSGNITVYAKWNSYSYSVTYDSQGGSAVSGSTVNSPATTVGTLPSNPTKYSYVFGGWTNSSGVAFTASTTVSGNITVYAQWTLTNLPAVAPTFGVFSETVSNNALFDIDTMIDIWYGLTMADDTSAYREGTKSWKLTGTDPLWMGFGVRVNPLDNYKNMSALSGGSFRFSFKGQKTVKVGLKSGTTEYWMLPGQLMAYGLTTNNSWCDVSIPLSAFSGMSLSQMQSYLMFTANQATRYTNGDIFNVDHVYFTTNATTAAASTFGLFSESFPVNVAWDTDGIMEVWNGGFVLASESNTSGEGAASLKITANLATGNWAGLGLRTNPLNTLKDLSAYSGGYLTFMYKSTANVTKIGIKGGTSTSDERWITGATLVSTYSMKTDGTWCKVTIPLSAFSGLSLGTVTYYFMVAVDGANYVNGNVWYFDNIYFYK